LYFCCAIIGDRTWNWREVAALGESTFTMTFGSSPAFTPSAIASAVARMWMPRACSRRTSSSYRRRRAEVERLVGHAVERRLDPIEAVLVATREDDSGAILTIFGTPEIGASSIAHPRLDRGAERVLLLIASVLSSTTTRSLRPARSAPLGPSSTSRTSSYSGSTVTITSHARRSPGANARAAARALELVHRAAAKAVDSNPWR